MWVLYFTDYQVKRNHVLKIKTLSNFIWNAPNSARNYFGRWSVFQKFL